jgi:hypothetical protein
MPNFQFDASGADALLAYLRAIQEPRAGALGAGEAMNVGAPD